jgi:hypothetical protein
MRSVSRFALTVSVVALLLAGCGAAQPPVAASDAALPESAVVNHGRGGGEGITYTGSSCTYQFPMGYDNKGNLIGAAEQDVKSKPYVVCALLAGSKSETTLSLSGVKALYFPGSSMWDGKYIALDDRESGGSYATTGIYELTLSGTTLTSHGKVLLGDNCYSSRADVAYPFIVGKKNTPANQRQGKVVVGVNDVCRSSNISFWYYPAGSLPYDVLPDTASDGLSVTLKT